MDKKIADKIKNEAAWINSVIETLSKESKDLTYSDILEAVDTLRASSDKLIKISQVLENESIDSTGLTQ